MRRLVCTEDGSNKFWEGAVEGTTLVTRWGAVGGKGQSKSESFPSEDKASAALAKKVKEKLAKGYVEEGAASAAPDVTVAKAEHTKAPVTAAPSPVAPVASKPAAKAVSVVRFGFVDVVGAWAIPPQFDDVGPFSEGLAAVGNGGVYGYVDKTGAMVIAPEYKLALAFREGFAWVGDGAHEYSVDRSGAKLDGWVGPVVEGRRRYAKGAKRDARTGEPRGGFWGFADESGRVVVEPRWMACSDLSDGLAIARRGDVNPSRWVAVDRDGRERLDLSAWFDVRPFRHGRAVVMKTGGRYGTIDPEGKLLGDLRWTDVQPFSEGLARVRDADTGLFGFIALDGSLVVPCEYMDAGDFSCGRARVSPKGVGAWGVIDTTGKVVIPAVHPKLTHFLEGRALFATTAAFPTTWGAIDVDGKIVVEAKYTTLEGYAQGAAKAELSGKFGYIGLDGESRIACEWDRVGVYGDIVSVNRGGKTKGWEFFGGTWGFVDRRGEVLVPPTFDAIKSRFTEGLAAVGVLEMDTDPSRFPFYFYGIRPKDWGEGANMGHFYELIFASVPDEEAEGKIRAAYDKALAKGAAESGGINFKGASAQAIAGERKLGKYDDFFSSMRKAIAAVHAVCPLRQAVYLNARTLSDDEWERWTLARQPTPEKGEDFGHVALFFS